MENREEKGAISEHGAHHHLAMKKRWRLEEESKR